MGTPNRAKTALPNLCNLPDDVILQILDLLTPAEIAVYTSLNRTTAVTSTDSTVWASAARRHLAIAPSHPRTLTSSIVYDLAARLVCHWWLQTGLFVPGVPVHRRSGFTTVTPRGGIEVAIDPDSADTCYVFGGRHAARAIPASTPCVVLDFALDPAGPFPVDGMCLRILHAVEPAQERTDANFSSSTDSPYADSPIMSPSSFTCDVPPVLAAPPAPCMEKGNSKLEAHVTITLNSHVVETAVCKPTGRFTELLVDLPPSLLLTKPVLNTLSIEYSRESTAGYWLRDVVLTPSIVPLEPLPKSAFDFPLATPPESSQGPSSSQERTTSLAIPIPGRASPLIISPVQSPTGPRAAHRRFSPGLASEGELPGSHRSSRRNTDIFHGTAQTVALASPPTSPRHVNRPNKAQKMAKRPKYVYHKQNHYRSTRAVQGTGRGRAHR